MLADVDNSKEEEQEMEETKGEVEGLEVADVEKRGRRGT